MKKIILLTLFLVLAQGTSRAAIVEVPSQRAQRSSNSSPSTLDFPSNVTAGNLLCVAGAAYDGGGITTFNVSDSRSTNYGTSYVTNSGGTVAAFIACGKALSGGPNTITVQPDSLDTYLVYAIDEFTGQDTSAYLDADGGAATAESTTPTIDVTTSVANALILAVETDANGATSITEDGAWTLIGEEEDGSSYVHFSFIFRIVTTATTYTASWTIGNNNWAVYAISVKPGAAAGAPGVRRVIVVE